MLIILRVVSHIYWNMWRLMFDAKFHERQGDGSVEGTSEMHLMSALNLFNQIPLFPACHSQLLFYTETNTWGL